MIYSTVLDWNWYLSEFVFLALKMFEIRSAVQSNEKFCAEMQKRWQKEVDMMYNNIDCRFVV